MELKNWTHEELSDEFNRRIAIIRYMVKKAEMVKCPSCGEMNPANLTDCMKCGTPLKEEVDNERKDEPPKQQPVKYWYACRRLG